MPWKPLWKHPGIIEQVSATHISLRKHTKNLFLNTITQETSPLPQHTVTGFNRHTLKSTKKLPSVSAMTTQTVYIQNALAGFTAINRVRNICLAATLCFGLFTILPTR